MVCVLCQRRIPGEKRSGTKFCSPRCRVAAFRARRRESASQGSAAVAEAKLESASAKPPLSLAPNRPAAVPTLPQNARGARLEMLLLRIAPPEAIGYRLGYPDYRARISWFPNMTYVMHEVMALRTPMCFMLRPFEVPVLPMKGTYLLEFLDANGKPVQRTDWNGESGVQIETDMIPHDWIDFEAGRDHWEGEEWGDPRY